jgi:hypothetical protein
VGLVLGGSRAKSIDFVTPKSDLDVYVILSDNSSIELKEEFKSYGSEWLEIRVMTITEFSEHASWGSENEWDRYNFSHNTAVIDKTGEIQKILDEKGILPKEAQKKMVKDSLDNYINQVYRSAKYWRDGNTFAAYLDAVESLPHLMTALYALENRIKPYNKYFEWELKNYPLELLPWSTDEFISDYKHILGTGDIETQKKIFEAVKKLFNKQGYDKAIDGWKGYYFVG